jgi:3-dehydroquinate synthase
VVSTTLLGMVDAALGGKTGFDYLGIKNLIGTFFPAERVIMPLTALESLPPEEWKSGMAELIKTAVISGDEKFVNLVKKLKPGKNGKAPADENLAEAIARAVETKGRIVEEDPKETGVRRALLNLGHTFGHALESAAGLGAVSHGEAVAWGMARSCELGAHLGITPVEKAREIINLLKDFGYETRAPHPLNIPAETFLAAMTGDKKKKQGNLTFVVPVEKGAVLVSEDNSKTAGPLTPGLVEKIIKGDHTL